MINHANYPNVDWNYNAKTECFEYTAAKNINFGEELTISYGEFHSRSTYLLYGFVLDDNKEGHVTVCEMTMLPEAEDTHHEAKAEYLGKNFISQKFAIKHSFEWRDTNDFLGLARWNVFDEEDMPDDLVALIK